MKALECEMCGSRDLIKDNGVFVCQNCGCKYSVAEARRMMMLDEPGYTAGVVNQDNSESFARLVQRAEEAFIDGRYADAYSYAEKALDIDQKDLKAGLILGLATFGKEPFQNTVSPSCVKAVEGFTQAMRDREWTDELDALFEFGVTSIESVFDHKVNELTAEERKLGVDLRPTRGKFDIVADLCGATYAASSNNHADDKRIEHHNNVVQAQINECRDKISILNRYAIHAVSVLKDIGRERRNQIVSAEAKEKWGNVDRADLEEEQKCLETQIEEIEAADEIEEMKGKIDQLDAQIDELVGP